MEDWMEGRLGWMERAGRAGGRRAGWRLVGWGRARRRAGWKRLDGGGVEAWKEVCVVDGGHAGLDRGGRDGGWKVGMRDWRAGWKVGWRGGWRVGWGWMEFGWVAGDRTARTESESKPIRETETNRNKTRFYNSLHFS